jgi:hypothetical protein
MIRSSRYSRFSAVNPILEALDLSFSIATPFEFIAQVVDKALFQSEPVQGVAVFHRGVDLLLELAGDPADPPEVVHEMGDRPVDDAEGDVQRRLHPRELPGVEGLDVLHPHDHEAVGEEKEPVGPHLEEEVVLGGAVLGALEDDRDMVLLEVEAAQFVGIGSRVQSMLVDLEDLGDLPLLLPGRSGIDQDRRVLQRGMQDTA